MHTTRTGKGDAKAQGECGHLPAGEGPGTEPFVATRGKRPADSFRGHSQPPEARTVHFCCTLLQRSQQTHTLPFPKTPQERDALGGNWPICKQGRKGKGEPGNSGFAALTNTTISPLYPVKEKGSRSSGSPGPRGRVPVGG